MNFKVKYSTMVVRDMEESIKFYSEVMGFEIDSQYNPQPGLMITLMKSEGETLIELIKNPTNEIGF